MKQTETIIRTIEDRNRVLGFISTLPVDKPLVITVDNHIEVRSLSQNRLIHKWFGIIAKDTGDTARSVKADLTHEFAPMVESKTNADVMRPMGTSEMDKIQMIEFTARLYKWACDFGISLPHPDDQGR